MKKDKKKIGIFTLSCCEGCECVVLEHLRDFLAAMADVDVVEMRLLEEDPCEFISSGEKCLIDPGHWDIAFVEGSAITRANLELLKKIREHSKILVTLGNCAQFGGVHKMKNYRGKDKLAKELYKFPKTIDNSEIEDMENLVKVDYNIPGCPITAGEFLRVTYDLLNGRKPKIAERTVCYECQRRGFPCLLQRGSPPHQFKNGVFEKDKKENYAAGIDVNNRHIEKNWCGGEPCMGPITLGGCNAVCLESRMPCEACRGFYEGANFESLFEKIDKQVGKKRREEILEIFGVRDRLKKITSKSTNKS